MRIYEATSDADAAAWLRTQLTADGFDPTALDTWQAEVVTQFAARPLPRQVTVDVYTDGRLTRAAQIAGIDLTTHWPDSLFVLLPAT